MQNDKLQMPIWGPSSIVPGSEGHLSFQFDAPPQPFVNSDHNTSLLQRATEYYDNRQYTDVVEVLVPLVASEDLARPILLDCLLRLDDSAKIASVFDPPRNAPEAIALMDALWSEGTKDRLAEILTLPLVAESADSAVVDMRKKYEARLGL